MLKSAIMFKKVIPLILAGIAFVATSQALTIDFNQPTPAGVGFSGQYVITDQSLPGRAGPNGPGSGYYFAVYNKANPNALSTATISLNGTYHSLSFNWSAVNNRNMVQFLHDGSVVASMTGSNIMAHPLNDQGYNGSASFAYSGAAFDSVRFLTAGTPFEIADINAASSVPDGSTTAILLGLAMLSIVAVRAKLCVA